MHLLFGMRGVAMRNFLFLFIVLCLQTRTTECLRSADLMRSRSLRVFSGPQLPTVTRSTKRNLKLLFVLALLVLESSSEVFVRLPQQLIYGSTPQYTSTRMANQDSVVLIFPGAAGPDSSTELLKERILNSDKENGINRYVEVYDWLKWRGNFLRASFDSQIVGNTVCSVLADAEKQQGEIKNLHVIGVSVGAFAADSCIKIFNKDSHPQLETRLTLLDPFTSKGVFGYGWGAKNFGKGADVTEDYMNSDDPVPTTNEPLPLAYTFDVTNSISKTEFKPRDGDSMHSWPIMFLAQNWQTVVDDKGKLLMPTAETEPIGEVYIVP